MSSVSAIFGVKIGGISPDSGARQPSYGASTRVGAPAVRYGDGIGENFSSKGGLMIECSSRPQKKATAHHRKTRPKKTQPWDRNRGPTVYPPLPVLPPEWSFVTDEAVVEAASSPPLPASSE